MQEKPAAVKSSARTKPGKKSGRTSAHAHELEQMQHNLAAAVEAEAEKARDITSIGQLLVIAGSTCLPLSRGNWDANCSLYTVG